jgi:hypothetical protein
MSMIPGVVAAVTYGTIKIGGYAVYAYWLNRHFKTSVTPLKFGFVKTLVGLAFGWFFLFFGSHLPEALQADFAFWLTALPLRLLAWLLVIAYFYKSKISNMQLFSASVLGVVITYALDLVMLALFNFLPSMKMPMC